MAIKYLFICLFIISFIFFLLILVKHIPIRMVKMRAKKFGVKLKNNEAKKLINMGCVNAPFFKQISSFVQQKLEFDTVRLGLHYVSGGSLDNVLRGVLYAQNNGIAVESSEIFAIDLAGQDIVSTLKKRKSSYSKEVIVIK